MGRRGTTNSILASFVVWKMRTHIVDATTKPSSKWHSTLRKNKQIILERWWFTTCRCQMKVITTQAAFTFSSLLRQTPTKPRKACEIWNSVGMLFEVSNDVRTTSERRIERRQRASKPRPQSIILSVSFHYPFSFFHFLSFVFSHFFRIDSKHKKHHEPEHHVVMNAW